MQKLTYCLLIGALLFACSAKNESDFTAFDAFCEMVAHEVKPIALSNPMTSAELDNNWDYYQRSAATYGVSLYRETRFPQTPLWPSSVTEGKEVVVIYKGDRLVQYEQLKNDLETIDPTEGARRFGRLLGYSPQGINELLMKNTDFKTLESFGVKDQVTHLYYDDLDQANAFYSQTLGFEEVGEHSYKISDNAFLSLHSFNESHPKGQSKSTAIAFLTDQLPKWYAYVQEQGVPIKYTYKPREGGPHDGFVAIDPGGYLLEFEQFKQHPENERFMAALQNATRVETAIQSLNFYGSITWTYHNDLLEMQTFYEEVLGFTLVADQGWTKIYQTTSSGFIGLVDERRGMMDYADEKAIEVEWRMGQPGANLYFAEQDNWDVALNAIVGPEKYRYLIR